MTPAARSLATVLYLDEFRPPADLLEAPQPPAPVQRGEDAHRSRASLADCWHRSQLRRDLLAVGSGLLIGGFLLAVVLWVLSVAGWLPV